VRALPLKKNVKTGHDNVKKNETVEYGNGFGKKQERSRGSETPEKTEMNRVLEKTAGKGKIKNRIV